MICNINFKYHKYETYSNKYYEILNKYEKNINIYIVYKYINTYSKIKIHKYIK